MNRNVVWIRLEDLQLLSIYCKKVKLTPSGENAELRAGVVCFFYGFLVGKTSALRL